MDRIYESIFINVTLSNGKQYVIGSIYRPCNNPNLTQTALYENFSELFSNTVSCLIDDQKQFYLIGDLNIDVLKYNSNARATDFINLLFSFGLLQVITKPSRCTDNSATLIDHVITNCYSDCFKSVILTSKISDHFPIIHFLPEKTSKKTQKFIEKRDFSKRKIENFKTVLSNISWIEVQNAPDVHTGYNLFSDTFFHLYNLHFPIVKLKFNKNCHNLEPWMSSGLLISRLNKFSLSSQFSRNPTIQNKTIYCTYRNVYNRLIRAAKKLYFDREFEKHKSNLKKTWDLIKFAINSENKNQTQIHELFSNGIKHTDPLTIANELNHFFINAPLKIVSEIPDCKTNPVNETVHDKTFSLSESPVTRTEIMDAISQLLPKKSEDMFSISMFTVKQFVSSLIEPLYHIIYKSFETGAIPEQLKIAKIIPIHKSGDRLLPDNYRPISLLRNFSNILEKVMSNRLTYFLESNNLLCQEQFGFRKSHSTLHPLVHFLNKISEAKNLNKHSIAIFCDLRKAFDTVDHKILLKKLYNLGVRGIELKWFENYLANRKQFVQLNGKTSTLLSILIGVPQGSILGPLLFLIYINDLPLCNRLNNSLFADDTMLLESHEDLPFLVSKINQEFHKIVNYFQFNKLALHKDKTKFLIFFKSNNTPTPDIFLNFNDLNEPIQNDNLKFKMCCVNDQNDAKIKFLGVLIDPFLTFKDHIIL